MNQKTRSELAGGLPFFSHVFAFVDVFLCLVMSWCLALTRLCLFFFDVTIFRNGALQREKDNT
jgi:hypothetical protein